MKGCAGWNTVIYPTSRCLFENCPCGYPWARHLAPNCSTGQQLFGHHLVLAGFQLWPCVWLYKCEMSHDLSLEDQRFSSSLLFLHLTAWTLCLKDKGTPATIPWCWSLPFPSYRLQVWTKTTLNLTLSWEKCLLFFLFSSQGVKYCCSVRWCHTLVVASMLDLERLMAFF